MSDEIKRTEARKYFARAYEFQMNGQLDEAVDAYKRSIELDPTAEAHTFLGWTYSFLGRFEDAIQECKRAIEIDPEFGNPWNDIGAYLLEMGKEDEAVPFLERAVAAKRYDARCFAHYNLSRVFAKKGMIHRAIDELRRAVEFKPDYRLARETIDSLERQLN